MEMHINHQMIAWARERAGFSMEILAEKLGKDINEIELWENGVTAPSYATLETLAYRYFKIPLALFFYPHPPEIEDPVNKFRKLPSFELERISPDTHRKIRLAQSYQDSLYELLLDTIEFEKTFTELSPKELSPPEFAHIVRQFLGVSFNQQMQFPSCEEALKAWRHALENISIFTFKDSFKDRFISGLSLLDDQYPVIMLNNSNAFSRQIFTLIHELAHILYGINGITDFDESYIDLMDSNSAQLERNCNSFAAHFLVPDEYFSDDIPLFKIAGMDSLESIAHKYSVSREVILRRLVDSNTVSSEKYAEISAKWNRDYFNRPSAGDGGDYYRTRLAYLGENFTNLAFENYASGRITRAELGSHLNMNSKNLSKLETYLR